MQKEWLRTYHGVAHPWLCDVMGHMTTRHYIAMFDDASYHFLAALGSHPIEDRSIQLGWADVRQEIDYLAEVPAGALVSVFSRPLRIGTKSLTYENELRRVDADEVSARLIMKTVRFDLKARKAVSIDASIKNALAEWQDA